MAMVTAKMMLKMATAKMMRVKVMKVKIVTSNYHINVNFGDGEDDDDC